MRLLLRNVNAVKPAMQMNAMAVCQLTGKLPPHLLSNPAGSHQYSTSIPEKGK
jgi:hypothetical protein